MKIIAVLNKKRAYPRQKFKSAKNPPLVKKKISVREFKRESLLYPNLMFFLKKSVFSINSQNEAHKQTVIRFRIY